MKKLIFSITALAISLSAMNLNACGEEKIYVDTRNAYQCNNHFRVQLDNGDWIDAVSVHGDQNGIYVYKSGILEGPQCWEIIQEKTWKCQNCGYDWPVRFKKCPNENCPNKWK